MTLLGHHSPHLRLANAVRGLARRPVPRGPKDEVFVVGRRGAPKDAPENTVESFARAIALGADAIEADVCVTRDGRFVLWHDCRPDDKVALLRQASLGVDGILTDEPELLRGIVGARAGRPEAAPP